MKKFSLRLAVIIFGLSLVIASTGLNKDDFKLFGYVNNDIHLTLEKHLSADIHGVKPLYKDTTYKFLSDIELADFPFSSLALEWEQRTEENTGIDMDVRFFDGIEWGKWNGVAYESDEIDPSNKFYRVDAIINTNPAESFQYRVTLNSDTNEITPEFKNVKFTYVNANDEPIMAKPKVLSSIIYEPGSKLSAASINNKGIRYISRAGWGANESLRLYKEDGPEAILVNLPSDFYVRYAQELKLNKIISTTRDGNELTWPLQYPETMQKIIIHHTGTTRDLDNPAKAIRDIYYYHTIGKGWGDIGYNYIIDQNGNVYEGRHGGEGVVGAHAGPGNKGSIGIAILGNYDDKKMNPNVQKALEILLSEKTKLHGVDPMGVSYFRGQKLPNIIGHNSVMATSCPGSNIIRFLPIIRRNVSQLNGNFDYNNPKNQEIKEYDFKYIATLDEINLKPEKKMQYVFRLQNTGTKTWSENTRIAFEKNPLVIEAFSVSGTKLKENYVKPGGIGTFSVNIASKMKGGFHYIPLKPIFNGTTISTDTLYIPTIVEYPVFAYELVDISIPKSIMSIGDQLITVVSLKNTGNINWKNYGENRISLGSDNPRDRVSAFTKSTRMGYLKESIVAPSEIGHFIFNLKAPASEGVYEEYFAPVIERIVWLEGQSMKLILNVNS
ncbi:N-acetylmuramoyl-L-alanine amidase [Patescibacteria group bacterium]